MGCEMSNMRVRRKFDKNKLVTLASSILNEHRTHPSFDSNCSSKSSTDRQTRNSLSSRQNSILNRSLIKDHTETDLQNCIKNKTSLFEYFSEFEKDVLISTWSVLGSNHIEHGSFIFKLAGNIFPGLRSIFSIEPEGLEMTNPEAQWHCLTFMKLIDDAVNVLECQNNDFYDKLILAGANYATLTGMKTEYFKVFKRATLTTWEALLAEEFTEDVKQAWKSLFDYLITIMSQGCLLFEKEEENAILEEVEKKELNGNKISEATLRLLCTRPSVVSMTSEEWNFFQSVCK